MRKDEAIWTCDRCTSSLTTPAKTTDGRDAYPPKGWGDLTWRGPSAPCGLLCLDCAEDFRQWWVGDLRTKA